MATSKVIGQTGQGVLSDDTVQYKQLGKRTVRYQYTKLSGLWMAWVCGPFHSRTYGVCGFGTAKRTAKAALQRRLADDFGHIGLLMFSAVDDADNIRKIGVRIRSDYPVQPIPITADDVRGFGGYREYAKVTGPIM